MVQVEEEETLLPHRALHQILEPSPPPILLQGEVVDNKLKELDLSLPLTLLQGELVVFKFRDGVYSPLHFLLMGEVYLWVVSG